MSIIGADRRRAVARFSAQHKASAQELRGHSAPAIFQTPTGGRDSRSAENCTASLVVSIVDGNTTPQ
jgi:hypothetical protein